MSKLFQDRRRNCLDCTHWVNDACVIGVPLHVIDDPATFVCACNEIRPPETIEHKKIPGLFTRGWFDDPSMINEAARLARELLIQPGDVVMDLGAHVGTFGVVAMRERMAKAVIIEADPINWPMVDMNVRDYLDSATVLKLAVVGGSETRVTLWRTGYVGCSSVIERKRSFRTRVDAMNFIDVLHKYKPRVLKCDVEGAEHRYDWHGVNDELTEVHVEVHRPSRSDESDISTKSDDVQEALESRGFRLIDFEERMAFMTLHMRRS